MSVFQLMQKHKKAKLPHKPLRILVEQVSRRLGLQDKKVALILVDDEEIRKLNRAYLGRDRPTNVLSFPADAADELGEIVVNVDFAQRESAETGNAVLYLIGFYVIHGMLHLAGFDHERSGPEAADAMEKKQESLIELLEPITKAEEVNER